MVKKIKLFFLVYEWNANVNYRIDLTQKDHAALSTLRPSLDSMPDFELTAFGVKVTNFQ